MKNELIQPNNIEDGCNFSVIETFISASYDIAKKRQQVLGLVAEKDEETLVQMGFPSYIFPVMQLWNEKGPDILTSFSHPEELDFDKTTALFNLKLYQERMLHLGILLSDVLVNHYDTVPLKKSIQKPFRFSDFGSTFDLFAVGKERTSDVVVNCERIEKIRSDFTQNKENIALEVIAGMDNELVTVMKEKGVFASSKKEIRIALNSILSTRMNEVGEIIKTNTLDAKGSMGDLFMKFDQELMRRIFDNLTPIEEKFGFKSKLLSTNSEFLSLIRESIDAIVKAKGIGFLKEFIEKEGEAMCAIEDGNADRKMLTVIDNNFALVARNGEKNVISDEFAEKVVSVGKPLAKLESIALFAGAKTFHMGSEYGIRSVFVKKLGINGVAANYVEGLRIATDKKHGNFGIILKGTEVSPPTPLVFVLFGEKGFRNIVFSQVGKTNDPMECSISEFKKLAANALVEDAISLLETNSMKEGTPYGLTR